MGSRRAFSKRRTWSAFLALIPAKVMRWLDDCEKEPWPTAARRISMAITKLLLKYSLKESACKGVVVVMDLLLHMPVVLRCSWC